MSKKNFQELMDKYISERNKDNYFSKRINIELVNKYVQKKDIESLLKDEGNDFAYPDNYFYHLDKIAEILKRVDDLELNTKILNELYYQVNTIEIKTKLFEEMIESDKEFQKFKEQISNGKFKENSPDIPSLEEMSKEFGISLDKIYIPIEGLNKIEFTESDELSPKLHTSDLMKTVLNSHFIPKEDA